MVAPVPHMNKSLTYCIDYYIIYFGVSLHLYNYGMVCLHIYPLFTHCLKSTMMLSCDQS